MEGEGGDNYVVIPEGSVVTKTKKPKKKSKKRHYDEGGPHSLEISLQPSIDGTTPFEVNPERKKKKKKKKHHKTEAPAFRLAEEAEEICLPQDLSKYKRVADTDDVACANDEPAEADNHFNPVVSIKRERFADTDDAACANNEPADDGQTEKERAYKRQKTTYDEPQNLSIRLLREEFITPDYPSGNEVVGHSRPSTSNRPESADEHRGSGKRVKGTQRSILDAEVQALREEYAQEEQDENAFDKDERKLPCVEEYLNASLEEGDAYIPPFTGAPVCPYCNKVFSKPAHRNHHVKAVHLKIKPYKCCVCGKAFSEKQTLKVHGFLHTNEKRYECKFCDNSFRNVSNLYQHEKTHQNQTNRLIRREFELQHDNGNEAKAKRKKKETNIQAVDFVKVREQADILQSAEVSATEEREEEEEEHTVHVTEEMVIVSVKEEVVDEDYEK